MAFANQAAGAIENARLLEAERKRISELETVRQASLSLTASLELPLVLHAILKSALNLLPEAENTHIFLYDPQGDEVLKFGAALFSDGTSGTPWSQPRKEGLTYSVARRGEMIIVPDMQKHSLYNGAPSDWRGAIVGIPLKIGPQVVGVMNISLNQPREILETELRVLLLLGDQAAIAIENARLFQQAATERKHLSLLYSISQAMASSLDPDEILNNVVILTGQELGGSISEAFLYLPDENKLSLRAIHNQDIKLFLKEPVFVERNMGEGLVGWVAEHRQPAYLPSVNIDKRWMKIPGLNDETNSALCAPIIAGEQLLGVLAVLNDEIDAFSNEQLRLLHTICQGVGLALINAQRAETLELTVSQRTAELAELYKLSQEIGYPLSYEALIELLLHRLHNAVSSDLVVGCLAIDDLCTLTIESQRSIEAPVINTIQTVWSQTLIKHGFHNATGMGLTPSLLP